MAGSLGKRGKAGIGACLLSLGLLLSACLPGPPEPAPSPGTPSSAPPSSVTAILVTAVLVAAPSAGESVHFTAQGDIGVGSGAKKVLDVVAGLNPHLNLTLGDFAYKAGLEQQFCDMVTARLGEDFPYQLVTGNHESDGHDGDIEKYVQCLPNKLPGLQGQYGTQWRVDVPEQNPVVRFILVSPGIEFRGGSRWTTQGAANAGAGPRTPSTRPNRRTSPGRWWACIPRA